jgi:hypothetical protein
MISNICVIACSESGSVYRSPCSVLSVTVSKASPSSASALAKTASVHAIMSGNFVTGINPPQGLVSLERSMRKGPHNGGYRLAETRPSLFRQPAFACAAMLAKAPLDSASDWENAKDSAGRIPQTKTIRLPAGMALGYFLCSPLCAGNHLGFARQNGGFLIDRNASSKPVNSKHILPIFLTASSLHSRRSCIFLQRLPVLAKGRQERSA